MLNAGNGSGAVLQVVGVAQDIRYRALDFGSIPFVYLPLRQHYTSSLTLIVRSADGRSVARAVRESASRVSIALPQLQVRSLEDVVAAALRRSVSAHSWPAVSGWLACCSRRSACMA